MVMNDYLVTAVVSFGGSEIQNRKLETPVDKYGSDRLPKVVFAVISAVPLSTWEHRS